MPEGLGISAFDQEENLVYLNLSRDAEPGKSGGYRHAHETLDILESILAHQVWNPSLVARCLLRRFGTLNAVLAADEHDLLSVPGIDLLAARQIRRMHTVLSFCLRERAEERPLIGNMAQLDEYLRMHIGWKQVEEAHVLILDRKNYLIHDHLVGKGSASELGITVREVVRAALNWNGSALILAHNHPSGDPEPSETDIRFTRELASVLAVVDIAFHDHIVIGKNRNVSMRSQRLF